MMLPRSEHHTTPKETETMKRTMQEAADPTGIGAFAEGIAALVFAPDYYDGQWYAVAGRRRKLCRNHATAVAWMHYLMRHGFGSSDLYTEKHISGVN
jgi:hypothetical protein